MNRPCFVVAASLFAMGVWAQGVERATVEQKEAFVRRLLDDSPAGRRVVDSGHVEAIGLLERARNQHRAAQANLTSGDLVAADRALNEALWSAGKARQIVPDPMDRTILDRFQNARLRAGVESLRAAYERHLRRVRGPGAAVDREFEHVDALVAEAGTLADAEMLVQANRALQNAERELMEQLNSLLSASTFRYTERFENPADQFAYELDRNTSYGELVPIALAEYRPPNESLKSISAHVERGNQLRAEAQQSAGRKDFRAALRQVRAATAELQRALATAGLVVPRETPAERVAEERQ